MQEQKVDLLVLPKHQLMMNLHGILLMLLLVNGFVYRAFEI